ncbi:MAG: SgcJ/EcaC family oxidoreductase [Acidimicrobiia bacterium]|nr:SgcJ/EcaC family oxidoreductase [Acidimicrobiia bacterium]
MAADARRLHARRRIPSRGGDPMPPSAHIRSPARTPEDLHAIIQEAINGADLDAFLDAHDDDATVVVPPDGRSARGRDEIRAAIAPLLALAPEMATVVVKTLESDGLALTHGRWRLAVTEDGNRSELHGLGTMVSRRRPDGTWRIVLDDPLSGP